MVWERLRRRLTTLSVWSGGLVVAVAWFAASFGVPESYHAVIEVLAELLALLLIVLAWRFRLANCALTALVLALANHLLRGPLAPQIGTPAALEMAALGLLLPANLGLLALLRQRPVPTAATALHLVAILVQLGLVALLLTQVDLDATSGLGAWVRLACTREASLLAFLVAGLFAALALALGRGPVEWSMLWVLVATALALHGASGVAGATLMVAAAQLVLLLGVAENSYRLAYHDQLTGLPGRRALDEALLDLNGEYAIAMVDVDHFKRFNDRYGHEVGDQALRMVAESLRNVEGGGRAFRYGGEEFAVLYSHGSLPRVKHSLETLRVAIAERGFALRGPKRPRKKPEQPLKSAPVRRAKLTVSIGLATPNSRRPTPAEVIRAADKALYRAKKAGRNRLVGS